MHKLIIAMSVGLVVHGLAVAQTTKLDTKEGQLETINAVIKSLNVPSNTAMIIGSFDFSGKLDFDKLQGDDFGQNLRFFENDDLRAELNLVDEQKKEFDIVVETWNREHRLTLNEYQRFADLGKRERALETLNKLGKLDLKFEKEIRDLLLDHQYVWMKQIQVRYLVRTHGIKGIVSLEAVEKYADISTEELNRIRSSRKECKKLLDEKTAQLTKRTISDLFEGFSDLEIAAVGEMFPKFDLGTTQKFEQLRAHILMVDQFDEKEDYKSKYEELLRFPMFRLSTAGGLETTKTEFKFYEVDEDYIRVNLFEAALKSGSLDLDAVNVDRCEQVLKLMREKSRSLSMDEFAASGNTREEVDIVLERMRKRKKSIAAETLKRLESVLGDTVIVSSDKICVKVLERQWGPMVGLVYGRLGDQLQLSQGRKNRFRDRIQTVRREIDAETIKVELAILEHQLSKLDAHSRRKIESLLGPKLKHSPPSLVGLAIGL